MPEKKFDIRDVDRSLYSIDKIGRMHFSKSLRQIYVEATHCIGLSDKQINQALLLEFKDAKYSAHVSGALVTKGRSSRNDGRRVAMTKNLTGSEILLNNTTGKLGST